MSVDSRPDTAGRKALGASVGLPVVGGPSPRAAVAPQLAETLQSPPTVAFVSLGCAKNLVDSEMMLGQLAESGALLTGDESAADTVVVNTCGFLEASREEALEILRELAERKRAGGLKRIVVAGCLVQRDGERIRDWVPEVDALVGVNNRDDVVRAVWRQQRDAELDLFLSDYHAQPWADQGRLRLTPPHYAYMRISEGCNQKCTFCTIPSIRGPMHCKSPEALVAEGRELTADGAREILLIGQDTTSYGADIGFELGLAGLIRRLDAELADARWLRLMYVYPTEMTDAIIDAIAVSERFVKYIDIPLQHINDRMLKRMHRRVTRRETETLLARLRERIPGVTIRTTFIVGFPGESDAEFAELCEFVRGAGFDAVGAFPYSREAETPAGRMQEQIDAETRAARYEALMLVQQEVALASARQWIGRRYDVVIDECGEEEYIARHSGQAPDVDAVCRMRADDEIVASNLQPGDLLAVRCVAADGYDLVVEPNDEADDA